MLDRGFRPSEFGLCDPADDLSVMIAYRNRRNKMEIYEVRKAKKKENS